MKVAPGLAFGLCVIIWGTTWLGIRFSLDGIPPIWAAFLRFALATLLLVPVVALRGGHMPRNGRQWAIVAYVGFTMFVVNYGLIYWAEQSVDSGMAAILFATNPLFLGLLGPSFHTSERVPQRHWIGVLVSLGGLLIVFTPDLHLGLSAILPMLAIVAGSLSAASSSLAARRWAHDLEVSAFTYWSMVFGCIGLAATSLLGGETPTLPPTTLTWAAVAYLALFGSVIAFLLFWDLIKKWPASRAGLLTLLTPIVAVASGALAGERFQPLQWLGSAIVLGGVAVALLRPHVPPPAPAAQPAK